jgi:hypothetical protein
MTAHTLHLASRRGLLSASRRRLLRGRRGNDGLTGAERAEFAARWRAGAGAPVTQEEANQFRAAAAAKKRLPATG